MSLLCRIGVHKWRLWKVLSIDEDFEGSEVWVIMYRCRCGRKKAATHMCKSTAAIEAAKLACSVAKEFTKLEDETKQRSSVVYSDEVY